MTPRQLRDTKLPARLDTDHEPKWWAQLGYAGLGALLMWLFLTVALGWPL